MTSPRPTVFRYRSSLLTAASPLSLTILFLVTTPVSGIVHFQLVPLTAASLRALTITGRSGSYCACAPSANAAPAGVVPERVSSGSPLTTGKEELVVKLVA